MNITKVLAVLFLAASCCSGAEITPVNNRDYLNACVSLIDSARQSVKLSELYYKPDVSPRKIEKALLRAVERRVSVKVLLDDSIPENASAVKLLNRRGVPASLDAPKRQNHNKFIVVDGRSVLLGSTNLSGKSISENNETNVLISDEGAAAYYSGYFDYLYGSCRGQAPRYTGRGKGMLPLSPKRYFFAVKDILEAPHKKIGVIMYNMRSYPGGKKPNPAQQLLVSLVSAAAKGAEVRVVLEKSGHDEQINRSNAETAAFLKAGSVKVRFDSPEVITHAKLVLADGVAVLGSTNWGMAGFAKNEEANIELWESGAVAAYWKYFERQWNASKED
jgi:phosphatidylserine/phosphatidylglycerophosphate/cardiolipin synthase-like enzyme